MATNRSTSMSMSILACNSAPLVVADGVPMSVRHSWPCEMQSLQTTQKARSIVGGRGRGMRQAKPNTKRASVGDTVHIKTATIDDTGKVSRLAGTIVVEVRG